MKSVIIVLGSPNDDEGKLSPIAICRCKQALKEFEKNKCVQVICTGGFGENFNTTLKPHGFYTQQYLIEKGIPKEQFLPIPESRFTLEDATLAKPIIDKNHITDIILVTSDFHMPRAKLVFAEIFKSITPQVNFIYAPSKTLLPATELASLYAHEKKAIVREIKNIG